MINGTVPKEFVNFNIAAHFSSEREDMQQLDLSVA
jgi:hypothetical protein